MTSPERWSPPASCGRSVRPGKTTVVEPSAVAGDALIRHVGPVRLAHPVWCVIQGCSVAQFAGICSGDVFRGLQLRRPPQHRGHTGESHRAQMLDLAPWPGGLGDAGDLADRSVVADSENGEWTPSARVVEAGARAHRSRCESGRGPQGRILDPLARVGAMWATSRHSMVSVIARGRMTTTALWLAGR